MQSYFLQNISTNYKTQNNLRHKLRNIINQMRTKIPLLFKINPVKFHTCKFQLRKQLVSPHTALSESRPPTESKKKALTFVNSNKSLKASQSSSQFCYKPKNIITVIRKKPRNQFKLLRPDKSAKKVELSPKQRKNQKHNQIQFIKYFKNVQIKANITAQKFIVYNIECNTVLLHQRSNQLSEIASLTKIMTFLTLLKIVQNHSLLINQTYRVSSRAQNMIGTSAEISAGEVYQIQQLLYGLMLPSGNDAAVAIAEWAGGHLLKKQKNLQKVKKKQAVKRFVKQMNVISLSIGLKKTYWNNPTGLPDPLNKSCCQDLIRISVQAFKYKIFQKVVGTKNYHCQAKDVSGNQIKVQWENTNLLLNRKGFSGIKTGTTFTAGPCLASIFKSHGMSILIVTIRSAQNQSRFRDSLELLLQATRVWHLKDPNKSQLFESVQQSMKEDSLLIDQNNQ